VRQALDVVRNLGHFASEFLHTVPKRRRIVPNGRIGFVSWALMEQGNRCRTSTMQPPEGSHQTGIGSPTPMKVVDKCMSLPFLDPVPESLDFFVDGVSEVK
jgi:hypothetical protein